MTKRTVEHAFKLIGFCGNEIEYVKRYKQELEYVADNPLNLLTYPNVISSFCLKNIKENIRTRTRKASYFKFTFKKFKKILEEFIASFNKRDKPYKIIMSIVKRTRDKKGFYAFFSLVNLSNTQLTRKSKPNPRNITRIFFLYISKEDYKCSFYNFPDWIYALISWLLTLRLKVRFEDLPLKEFSSKQFDKFLSDKSIKIFELGLNKTEMSISDKIIIKSGNGEGYKYYDKLKGSVLRNEGLSIYDLDYLTLSYQENKKTRLNFKRKKGYNISIQTQSKYKDRLPKVIVERMGYPLYDKINQRELLKYLIHKRYIDKYDVKSRYISPLLEELKKLKIINIYPLYGYRCENPQCEYYTDKRVSIKPQCICGNIAKHKIILHFNIEINYNNILSLLGKGLKEQGYAHYRKLPEDYLGFKKYPLLRVEDKQDKYYYLLLNERGLSQESIQNLKINGLPFIIINLQGEISSTLPEFSLINAGDFLFSLMKKDYSQLNNIINNLDEKSHILRATSFKTAITHLNKKIITPELFEKCIFSLFNYIFPQAQKWGGKFLADGSFSFRLDRPCYLIWDAKRYDTTSLLEYVDGYFLRKDIRYMEKFNENKIIKNFGRLKYYMFVTSNTSKTDFMGMKPSIQNQIKLARTKKKLRNVRVVCLNKNELLELANFFNRHYDLLIPKYAEFLSVIRGGFILDDGYFRFNNVKKQLNLIIKETKIYPKVKTLRRENANT
jgi:hypothetical protein